ncbi:GFA family protein [Rhizorhabdus argentea]|uniref:GFA family protein n=1 Tax=Rhizorhabdus argentea TaxID=1387174 RepID=UPI0030EED398
MQRIASCNCGQLRARAEGEPVRISVCHCLACKRRTGSAFAHNAGFNHDQVSIDGEWKSWSRTTDTGRTNTFNFCPDCGSTVFYDVEMRPGIVNIPAGAFADPDFPAPTIEVYPERMVNWCTVELEP